MPALKLTGLVTKAGVMNKTVTVTVDKYSIHRFTGKRILRSKKYLTHDENNQLRVEDKVIIRNCRPLSTTKRFTLDTLVDSPEMDRLHRRAMAARQAAVEAAAAARKAFQDRQPADP